MFNIMVDLIVFGFGVVERIRKYMDIERITTGSDVRNNRCNKINSFFLFVVSKCGQ